MKNYIKLCRPNQWSKNVLIFLPAFFGFRLLEPGVIGLLFGGFFSFCLVASSIYVINDIKDVEEDKLHPLKRNRPIASGEVSIKGATVLSMILALSGFIAAYLINLNLLWVVIAYFVLNLAYSFRLKHFALLDILIIATGFLLRIAAGSLIIEQPLSRWLILMTFLLSLFVAFGKRYDDIVLINNNETVSRKSIGGYTIEFIQLSITLLASVLIVTYILYCFSEEVNSRVDSDLMYVTSFPVILAVLRYFQLVYVYNKGGEPIKIILKDPPMITLILVWFLLFFFILY